MLWRRLRDRVVSDVRGTEQMAWDMEGRGRCIHLLSMPVLLLPVLV